MTNTKTYFLSTLILFIFLTFTVQAQKFTGGIEGGINASEVSGDNLSGPSKFGLNGGIFTRFALDDKSALQFQLMYIQKGSKRNPSINNAFSYRFHLEYVELPVSYIFSVPRFKNIKVLGNVQYEAALSYARLMRYKEEANERLVLPGEKEDYHINEANLILGFYYPLSDKIDFHFRASNSLTPIRPHKGKARVWYNWGQYHTAWLFDLSYKF